MDGPLIAATIGMMKLRAPEAHDFVTRMCLESMDKRLGKIHNNLSIGDEPHLNAARRQLRNAQSILGNFLVMLETLRSEP